MLNKIPFLKKREKQEVAHDKQVLLITPEYIMAISGEWVEDQIKILNVVAKKIDRSTTIAKPLSDFFAENKGFLFDCGLVLRHSSMIYRFIRFPVMGDDELKGIMQYEMDQYLPVEANLLHLDHAIIDPKIQSGDSDLMEILVAGVRKDQLDPILSLFLENETMPHFVDGDVMSAFEACQSVDEEESKHLGVLSLGTEYSLLGVVRDGKPVFIRVLNQGTNSIFKKIKNQTSVTVEDWWKFLLGERDLEPEVMQVFETNVKALINDVNVSMDYYRDQSLDGQEFKKILIYGIGSQQEKMTSKIIKDIYLESANIDIENKFILSDDIDSILWIHCKQYLAPILGAFIRVND